MPIESDDTESGRSAQRAEERLSEIAKEKRYAKEKLKRIEDTLPSLDSYGYNSHSPLVSSAHAFQLARIEALKKQHAQDLQEIDKEYA